MRDDPYPPYDPNEQPPYAYPPYGNSTTHAPSRPFYPLPRSLSELTGPLFSDADVEAGENDLSCGSDGTPAMGQLLILRGRILDEDWRPIPKTLVEVWQANAAGKYQHPVDQRDAPIDPHFPGAGRCVTDDDGGYEFRTIKPGAYPVPSTGNWWRPPHIHFSLFGPSYMSRMVTQMYFPGDPLNEVDHILGAIPDVAARHRLVAEFAPAVGVPEQTLGYRFDLVLRGRQQTPMVD